MEYRYRETIRLINLSEHMISISVYRVRVTQYLVFCVVFCRSSFILCPFFFWPLRCIFVFDFTDSHYPLVSSNSSYIEMHTIVHFDRNNCCLNNFCTNLTFRQIDHQTSGPSNKWTIGLMNCWNNEHSE